MFSDFLRHHQFFCDKEMNEMYVSVFLMNLAESMIGIFVPIYLFSLKYSVAEILLFFLIGQLGSVLFALPVARLVAKFGAKHSILISVPFLLAYYFGLRLLPNFNWLFFIIPLGITFRSLFYNFGFELNYLDHCDRRRVGKDLSLFAVFSFAAAIVAPLAGGLVIAFAGYGTMFIIGSIILFLSVWPLFLTNDKCRQIDFSNKDIIKMLRQKGNIGMALSFVGYAVESNIGRVIWPVFLIIALGTAQKVGYLASIAAFLTIIVVYLAGRWSDRIGSFKLLRWGTVLYFFGWLGCLFSDSALRIFAVNSFKDMSQRFLLLPWQSAFYRVVRPENYFQLVVLRDMVFNASRVLVMPFIILIFLFVANPYLIVFLIAAFFSLLYPLVGGQLPIEKSLKLS